MPLNPMLHRRLERLFGRAKIVNEGQAFDCVATVDALSDAPSLNVIDRGEHYFVSCPFCRDTRRRLSVSHAWGEVDEHGRVMRFLVKCFNQDCLRDLDNYVDFCERMDLPSMSQAGPPSRRKAAGPRPPPTMPGTCVPLPQMPADHPTVLYLRSRPQHYDFEELWQKYRVSVCVESRYSIARGRIIAPVFAAGQLVGWQARHPADLVWKDVGVPKYWTCPGFQTGQHLYNLDRAGRWRTAVLVEGVTDVWSTGSMALASFGKVLSATHLTLLARAFPRPEQAFVLLYDPEERDTPETLKAIARLRTVFHARLAAVWLPRGTDPGSLERGFLRDFISQEAAQQGVRVVFAPWKEASRERGASAAGDDADGPVGAA